MEIATRPAQNALVIDMTGRLDTKSSGAAHDEMLRIVQGESKQIVVNLEKLEFVSSAGLRVLLRAAKLLQTYGGQLKLCSASEPVTKVIKTAGFDSLLHLYASEAEAIESF